VPCPRATRPFSAAPPGPAPPPCCRGGQRPATSEAPADSPPVAAITPALWSYPAATPPEPPAPPEPACWLPRGGPVASRARPAATAPRLAAPPRHRGRSPPESELRAYNADHDYAPTLTHADGPQFLVRLFTFSERAVQGRPWPAETPPAEGLPAGCRRVTRDPTTPNRPRNAPRAVAYIPPCPFGPAAIFFFLRRRIAPFWCAGQRCLTRRPVMSEHPSRLVPQSQQRRS